MILTQTNFGNPALEALIDNFYKNYELIASVEKTNLPLLQLLLFRKCQGPYYSYWLYLKITISPRSKHFLQHRSVQKIVLGIED